MIRARFASVLIALLALGALLSACGGDDDPTAVLEGATVSGLESGRFTASVQVEDSAGKGSDFSARVDGRFQRDAKGSPRVDLDSEVKSGEIDLRGGLTALDNRAFVEYKGATYEVEPGNFSFAKSIFLPSAEEGEGVLTACRQPATEIQVDELLANAKNEGSAEVDGVQTTKISGELDVPTLERGIDAMLGDASCKSALEEASPWPFSRVQRQLEDVPKGIKTGRVEIYVGDDGIVRKVSADLTVEPLDGGGPVTAALEFKLSEVNQPQKIEAPANPKSLAVLFGKLKIEPLKYLSLSPGEALAYTWLQLEPDLKR